MALLELGINWQGVSTRWGSEPLRLEISSSCGGTCFPLSAVVWCCCGARKTAGAQSPLEHWPGLCWLPTVATGHGWLSNDGGASHWPSSRVLASSKLTTRPRSSAIHPIPGGAQPAAPWVYLGRRLPQLSAASRRKWPFVTATMGAPLCSLPDYLPQREGWLPGGPGVLQRGPLLCPLIPGWVWGTLAALMGGSLLYQGTNAPTHM